MYGIKLSNLIIFYEENCIDAEEYMIVIKYVYVHMAMCPYIHRHVYFYFLAICMVQAWSNY